MTIFCCVSWSFTISTQSLPMTPGKFVCRSGDSLPCGPIYFRILPLIFQTLWQPPAPTCLLSLATSSPAGLHFPFTGAHWKRTLGKQLARATLLLCFLISDVEAPRLLPSICSSLTAPNCHCPVCSLSTSHHHYGMRVTPLATSAPLHGQCPHPTTLLISLQTVFPHLPLPPF